jgi:hypothetical protein
VSGPRRSFLRADRFWRVVFVLAVFFLVEADPTPNLLGFVSPPETSGKLGQRGSGACSDEFSPPVASKPPEGPSTQQPKAELVPGASDAAASCGSVTLTSSPGLSRRWLAPRSSPTRLRC